MVATGSMRMSTCDSLAATVTVHGRMATHGTVQPAASFKLEVKIAKQC